MKRFKKLFSAILIFFVLFTLLPEKANAADAAVTGWQSAFLNDVDDDGTPDMLPLVFNGTTSFTYYMYYQRGNVIPKDADKYGFPKEEIAKFNEYNTAFYNKYGFYYNRPNSTEYKDGIEALKDTYGEESEEYLGCLQEIEDLKAMHETCSSLYIAATKKWNADVDAFLAEHPEITLGHTVNPTVSYTETKENPLLYWLHIPYDYDPNKEYPIFIYAHGEDMSLGIAKYINADGTYKQSSISMSGDIGGLMSQWYNLVKDPGDTRDKYDCFFIYICNTNGFFRGSKDGYIYHPEASNPYYEQGGISIVNQSNDYDADVVSLTSELTGDSSYSASYKTTYDASRLSPGINEQLVCELIDELMTKYSIDEDRQYVMGFSLGGIYTMDIIAHYPDRFACAVPICTASADISDENCRALVDTNIWAISGNNDGTCSKYFSKFFVEGVNNAKKKYGTGSDTTVQYSFFSGGHSGGYAGPTLRNATSGVSITSDMQVIDFVFNSRRGHSTILCTVDGVSYGDFELAMSEASDSGKTVVLTADMTDVDFKDLAFTLDLNGHKLSGTSLNAENVTVINSYEHYKDAEYYASLTLNENIDINFSMENLGTGFDIENLSVTVDGAEAGMTLDKNGNVVGVLKAVAPNEMGEALNIVITYNGIKVKDFNYSILNYCNAVYNAQDYGKDSKLGKLCTALINYGKWAEDYYNEVNNISADASTVNSAEVIDFSGNGIFGKYTAPATEFIVSDTVTYAGGSLTLDSTITLNFQISTTKALTKDNILILNNLGEKVNPNNITVEAITDGYIIKINNIGASKLSRTYTLTINGVAESTFKIVYGVESYCYNVQSIDSQDYPQYTDTLKTLCKAIYNYAEAAKDYEGK